ncbi:MAG: cell surface protein [Flavobacteriaceae bacterium]|uniref:tetratricopeptide repeat protein n=1 Tax=Winogradskyella sp. SYSU M77433 TaxID=3042722 RepID=UPI000C64DA2A|nr:cell surface protein [Winogradskyella sp. SYSU M77433]MAX70443.1 cell surface protein [Flavobacteriaceae bacterium]MDH7911127.1 cell surface protein [Winogradskyella sp. SYSU M77433]
MILRRYLPLIVLVVMYSCDKKITKSEDYNTYLDTKIDSTELMQSAQFWTDKLQNGPNQFPYLAKRASAYTQIFNTTGNISYLIKAEEDLVKAIEMTGGKQASYLKILASNYISQHRFKEALELLKKAEENGENLTGTKKMLFDVYLELGDYLKAESYLFQIKNTSDFDYLIRLAKWQDHNGNLEKAIENMEAAAKIAESSNLKSNKQWSYTNLADFYGHAGEIEKSYQYYLKALELDTNDAHAKRGIAWIAYSYEKNPEEALRILNHVTSYYEAPDYNLLKAEIAEFKSDDKLKENALKDYQKSVANKLYGDMYNKYNVLLLIEDLKRREEAIAIALEEVENRPTPESYDLLAWSYFKQGDIEKAYAIVVKHIEGQTFEPEVLYHIAEIYKAAGKEEQVMPIKEELLASLYELGPTMEAKIKQL